MDVRERRGDREKGAGAQAGEPRRDRSRARLQLTLAALAGTVLALALPQGAGAAPPSHAARYTYELCDSALPGGASPALKFVVNAGVPIGYFDNCAQPGGSIGVSEWGHAEATIALLSVTVPETPGYRHGAVQVARDVRYYAHARPSLHSSPEHLQNGDWVHFWGQLPGPGRRGRVVVLQANVLGSKRWITFRKATSAGKGIFRAGYHFTSTTQATTYRFRAVVPVQDGYPWVQGHSKPVKVLVSR
jgi:hypothetical protein